MIRYDYVHCQSPIWQINYLSNWHSFKLNWLSFFQLTFDASYFVVADIVFSYVLYDDIYTITFINSLYLNLDNFSKTRTWKCSMESNLADHILGKCSCHAKCFAHTCLPNCDLHELDQELGTFVECHQGVKHLVQKNKWKSF